MCSPGEVVPESWDPGRDWLHRLLGWDWGLVDSDLCLHTGFLVAVAAALVFHVRLWSPSWQPQLTRISGAHLGGVLTLAGRQGRNPLSLHILKQWSLASWAGPEFFPDFFSASCGALAPFSLCSHSQSQSSPWDLTSKSWASAPSPHPPWQVSRQASQAGECQSAPIFCVEISPLCPLHPCCCALLHASEASPLPSPCLHQWRCFLVCGNFSSSTAPSQRCLSHPYSFVFVFSFFFCLIQVRGGFLAFWEVWGLLPVFIRCSVGVVPHVDVFVIYLWGGRWSPRLTPPSWRSPTCIFSNYGFLQIYAQDWNCWIIWYFYFFKELPYCSPSWMYQSTFPPAV